jgi:hypothetical protein
MLNSITKLLYFLSFKKVNITLAGKKNYTCRIEITLAESKSHLLKLNQAGKK